MRFSAFTFLVFLMSGCAYQSEIITSQPGFQVQDAEITDKEALEHPESINLRDIF